jgi:flagellar protein FlaF
MQNAIKAYASAAKETANPRELEALLLLKAASKLQSIYDGWADQPNGLNDAVLYNRRLWTVFLDSVCDETSLLPLSIRQNIANIGIFVMTETVSLMTNPRPSQLHALININRELAAGLGSKG